MADAFQKAANPVFYIKLFFIALALINMWLIKVHVFRAPNPIARPLSAKAKVLAPLMRAEIEKLRFEKLVRDTQASVSDMLRTHRERSGLSLREVARRMKFSAPFVSDVERGRRNCTIEFADAFMEALNK